MDWGRLAKKIAAAGAPTVGAVLAGPRGAEWGGRLAEVLGVDPEPDAISKAIIHDPDAQIALRKLELDAEADARAAELEAQKLAVSDVQHARASERDDVMRRRLAPIFVLMPLLVLGLIFWLKPEGEILGAGMMVVGLAIANAERVGNFFYGTSLGSKKKAEELAGLERR